MANLQQTSSKSDVDVMIDEKKRKRMLSNRESARRSRLKRQKRIEDLATEVGDLKRKIEDYKQMYVFMSSKASVLETENNLLAAEKKDLTQYLWKCYLILLNYKGTGCFPDNKAPEIKEPKLQPWEIQGQTIMASGLFKL